MATTLCSLVSSPLSITIINAKHERASEEGEEGGRWSGFEYG